MKTCRKCGVDKGYDGFYKDSSRPDGIANYCKPCHKLIDKISKIKTKSHIKAYNRLKNTIKPGVYAITNKGKIVYIGQSDIPYDRKSKHFTKQKDAIAAKRISPVSYKLSIGEYLRENLEFELIEEVNSENKRLQREEYYINRYKPELNSVS